MYRNNRILILIPARSGSTRIPGKNLKKVGGVPLVTRAVRAARGSGLADRILVSTDSKKIARVAERAGAEAPFSRPAYLSGSGAAIMPTIFHALSWCTAHRFSPDIVVVVQPTSPFTKKTDIAAAIKKLVASDAPSCVSVSPITERPEWMFTVQNGRLTPRERFTAARSQDLPPLYRLNGSVYAVKVSYLKKKKRFIEPGKSVAHVMERERSLDIDEPFDLRIAQVLAR